MQLVLKNALKNIMITMRFIIKYKIHLINISNEKKLFLLRQHKSSSVDSFLFFVSEFINENF